ncbi:MAG: hypothetical protein RML15_03815 [Bacteroidota bacterium]|nr:hypothetical protein [Candidatus Kapabacteria bacterium]MCX7936222.1 hypothetical protein [Chlorobiota bacterium]MDW8074883.1 hypothetical protein [Bacteroidota bacterium]MDW8271522.1 hypothetical protein [Bacteroidota bacterium]
MQRSISQLRRLAYSIALALAVAMTQLDERMLLRPVVPVVYTLSEIPPIPRQTFVRLAFNPRWN